MVSLPPALKALLLQLLAALLVLCLLWWQPLSLTPFGLAFTCGVLACLLSIALRQARWWWLIHLLFLPLALLVWSWQIPSSWFLLAFVLLWLVYWSTFKTQVPLYLSSQKVWAALTDLLPPQAGFRLVDLGCGLGGVLWWQLQQRPDGHYEGVELAPLPYFFSRLRLRKYAQCRIARSSFWDCDLSQYDVVFAYLSPVPMAALWQKAQREMKPGSLFISSSFEVPGQQPDQVIEVDDFHHSRLLVWRISATVAPTV